MSDTYQRPAKPIPRMATMPEVKSALQVQVGGTHYKDMPIQHVEFCQRNKLTWCESAAIKYLCRHRNKNKAEDVKKAIHYCELLMQLEYPEVAPRTPGYDGPITGPVAPHKLENCAVIELKPDGDMWSALMGTLVGFGKTRADALRQLAFAIENPSLAR